MSQEYDDYLRSLPEAYAKLGRGRYYACVNVDLRSNGSATEEELLSLVRAKLEGLGLGGKILGLSVDTITNHFVNVGLNTNNREIFAILRDSESVQVLSAFDCGPPFPFTATTSLPLEEYWSYNF